MTGVNRAEGPIPAELTAGRINRDRAMGVSLWTSIPTVTTMRGLLSDVRDSCGPAGGHTSVRASPRS
jgi:hypothetical protein